MIRRGHADTARAAGRAGFALPRLAAVAAALLGSGLPAAADEPAVVRIAYLAQEVDRPPPLSLIEPILTDDGVQGARLAIADNAQSKAIVTGI